LEISEAVSEMQRLGWPPAWGNGARVSGQIKSGVERRIQKFTKGAPKGEPSLAVFGGAVF
jgi:hypothetical protein